MDFSVIRRPKPPSKKPTAPSGRPQPPPPNSGGPPPPQNSGGPPPAPNSGGPPSSGGPPPPRPPRQPYMEELEYAARMNNMRSVEYTNTRTWRMNFGDDHHHHHPNNYYDNYGDYYYCHQPVRTRGPHDGPHGDYDHHHHHHDHHRMLTGPLSHQLALPPPDYHHPSGQLALPPPDYHHPSQHLALPPPEYHGFPPREYYKGPVGPHPVTYYYPPPYHGGMFSDENPNGCMIM